ncbi:MAG TPA: transposase, partial [Saprospiraceae bacterium]|nr:transposase [Saprospiraceae bacterium]
EVLALLDLETIQICDTSFINDDLRETFADVLFSFKLKGEDKELYISVLLEHKSVPDKNTPIQVLYYIAQAYYDQIQNGEKLQTVLPLVYYHGKKTWEYKPLDD